MHCVLCAPAAVHHTCVGCLVQEGRVIADAQSGKARQLRNLSMHLRKAAIHPYLMLADPGSYEHYRRDLVRASGKMVALDGLLAKLHATGGHRA